MGNKTSLKDIANHVGVSTALVSYVLNNKEKEARVGVEMAEKIRKAAAKLNYQPNLLAKGLKSGKTKTLGLLVADISNPFFSAIARIIEDEAGKSGYTVIFGSSDEGAEQSMRVIDAFLNRQVDGLIIAPADHTQDQIKVLAKKKIPFVLIDRYFPELNAPAVYSNNFEASYEAVTHLINNGFSRIAMVTYKNELHHTQERKRGYLKALKDHKIAFKKQWLLEVEFDDLIKSEEKLLSKILLPEPGVDAVFFSTNSLAMQGLKQIKELDITVPDKVAIISFDETDAFDFFYSPITYVKQDLTGLGKESVNLLFRQMKGEATKEKSVEVKAKLIVKESCGSRGND